MISFKIASDEWEFNEIHKLNYETFVEEIPQHHANSKKMLVDKFHSENRYIICLKGNSLAGMIAVRDKRPFSLDHKVENLDRFIPGHSSVCELRLLSIKQGERNRKIIMGLFRYLAEFCEQMKYDLAIISATTKQERLYSTLGFKPFGPLVGTNGARYQPMYLTPGSYFNFKKSTKVLNKAKADLNRKEEILLQPGPVKIKKEVREAFQVEPLSHRSAEFHRILDGTRKKLCELTNSNFVQVLMGSGTLANDMIAAQLSTMEGKGMVLQNGEFGERLFDHAERFGLDFDELEKGWGEVFDYDYISTKLEEVKYRWLWFVHCETSTGILNDLERLKQICGKHNVFLCVDCVSSLGAVETDLSGVYLASGSSGKALAAYPGLSLVFHQNELKTRNSIPRYLDLGYYQQNSGVPFTLSSNLLMALKASLEQLDVKKNRDFASGCSRVVRDRLEELNVEIINNATDSSPAVVTFRLGDKYSSLSVGEKLEDENIFLSYRSKYLTVKNLIQFVMMGEYDYKDIERSLEILKKVLLPK